MKCSVLSSGSKANCTYIETKDARILIDCGLSCRKCEEGLRNIGVNADNIDAIFVTHSHFDHIKGISLFSNKHRVPVYATRETLDFIKEPYEPIIIEAFNLYKIKGLNVDTASTCHDAQGSLCFNVSDNKFSIGYLTDVGVTTNTLVNFFKNVDMLILEFNHDPLMLQISDYPYQLKKRIASNYGHLSNVQACEFFKKVYHKNLKALLLAHISENNNKKEIALKDALRTLNEIDKDAKCYIEPLGDEQTDLYDIGKEFGKEFCRKNISFKEIEDNAFDLAI